MPGHQESSSGYTEEEANKLGYEWGVVEFFKRNAPELITIMWGNNSDLYSGILKGTISDDKLEASLDNDHVGLASESMTSRAARTMLRYRMQL